MRRHSTRSVPPGQHTCVRPFSHPNVSYLTLSLPLIQVWDLLDGVITEKEVSPATFGLALNSIDSVRGGTPEENAATLLALLGGELPLDHPVENFVAANCGALLFLSGLAKDPIDGVRLARESIKSGKALEALDLFRKASQAGAISVAK